MLLILLLSIVFMTINFYSFSKKRVDIVVEELFFSFTFALITITCVSLILVTARIYNINILLILILVLNIFLMSYHIFKNKKYGISIFLDNIKSIKINWMVIGLIFFAIFIYFFFPIEYLLGGRDTGLYPINAVRISQTGQYTMSIDNFLNSNYENLDGLIRKGEFYPGFYDLYYFGYSSIPGSQAPQFLPMFSSALAIGYDVFGFVGLFAVPAVFGITALLAVYFFSKRYFGYWQSIITLIFFILCPAQIWASRITLTEILSQLLYFIGIHFCGLIFTEKKSLLYVVISAVMLSLGSFNRIDHHIIGIGVYLFVAYIFLFKSNFTKNMIYFISIYTVISFSGLLLGKIMSPVYYEHLWRGSIRPMLLANVLCLLIAFLCLVLQKTIFKKGIKDYIVELASNQTVIIVFSLVLLAVYLFAFFIRPTFIKEIVPERIETYYPRSAIDYSYYVSFIGIPLAILGMASFLRKGEKSSYIYIFLLTGASNVIVYLFKPSITPDHMWMSRRWITVAIPFTFVLMSQAIVVIFNVIKSKKHLKKPVASVVSIGLTVGLAAFLTFQSKLIIFQPMFQNMPDQIAELAAVLDDDKIYYTDNEQFAGSLKYIFDKNIYLIHQKSSIDEIIEHEGKVNYITTKGISPKDYTFEVMENVVIEGEYPEIIRSEYIKKLDYHVFNVLVVTGIESRDVTKPFSYELDLHLDIHHRDTVIEETVKYVPNSLTFGPYYDLNSGDYKVTVSINNINNVPQEGAVGSIYITQKDGKEIFTSQDIIDEGIYEMEFSSKTDIENLEILIKNTTSEGFFEVEKIELEFMK